MDRIERGEEPMIFSLSEDDKEMNSAIELANKTLEDFDKALKFSENEKFALKIRYDVDDKSEHIWAVNIEKIDDDYFGIIDNLPNSVTDIKLTDKVKIDKDKISDWMFSKKGKLVGGFTIRVIRNRMSELEKEKFDKEFILSID
ncbi:DUF2314 domain-containing protein [Epilithonimonas arachidiradicis]|uniref:Uncharacterized protein YegJ (DUF2314 family) n=1 Tax=Epilithonimonas arachidiradicis TaxID=1617282 RepID=A0A420CN16_9FLAO|nr:DUF2314 domain-containing protein [Epilithonimonas arachidiradicis]RKE79772.1 uncharacterized protein YegJ (DUF2314 family) [Epilithonimonas arachidiradicis]GGG51901.1 hypothetical protein GCM10007332_11940 [Epilithonimonas arachidiradicis]